MWNCTGCGWTGKSDELRPVKVSAGIQGIVDTFACPKCDKTVGEGVNVVEPAQTDDTENISQEISGEVTGEESSSPVGDDDTLQGDTTPVEVTGDGPVDTGKQVSDKDEISGHRRRGSKK